VHSGKMTQVCVLIDVYLIYYYTAPNLPLTNFPLTHTHAPVLSVIGAASAIAHALTLFKTLSPSLRSMMAQVLRMEIGRQLLARALLLQAFCTSRRGNMPHVIAPTRNLTRDEHASGNPSCNTITSTTTAATLEQQMQLQAQAQDQEKNRNCHTGKLPHGRTRDHDTICQFFVLVLVATVRGGQERGGGSAPGARLQRIEAGSDWSLRAQQRSFRQPEARHSIAKLQV
jgi:hypothetical protein